MRAWGIAALALSISGVVTAQQAGGAGGAPASSAGGSIGRTPTRQPTSPFPDDNGLGSQPIFISGTVLLSDGTALTERAKIERVCNGSPRLETYTDKKGRFSFEVGRSLEMQDASSGTDINGGAGSRLGGSRAGGASSRMGGSSAERALWGCELRAALAGFRSDVVSLTNIHYMDNPDVGAIILHRLGNVDGLTISVVSALAPKDARKAYEKGREAASKRNLDEAQKNFEKAVELYPKYSVAWFDLGRLQEQRDHAEEARKAYEQAVAAEPKYVEPYERLSWLALHESKWQELVDRTDQWLRLDPMSSPDVYYLSSIGNLQTQHLDAAEKNAREAIRLDPAKKNMRTRYILGLALAQKQEFTASAEAIRTFLEAAPDAKEAEAVRKQLAQIEEAARGKTQAKQE
jgi:tetratricopeptide (TPR) repeat protein